MLTLKPLNWMNTRLSNINYAYLLIIIFSSFLFIFNHTALSQCLTAPNGQWPSGTFTPACTGSPESITSSGYAGEYSVVYVISGTGYTFTSSNSSDYITISNSTGTIAYAYGTTPVSWTATITGNIRFYTHTSSACGSASISRTRYVTCSAPAGPCFSAPNGQWPSGTFTPACTGSPESITSGGYAGEYSVVNVINGTNYTFTSSNSSDYITISNNTGTIGYAYGTTPVVWSATFTGTIRFYTHTSSACGSASISRTRYVTCSGAPPSGPANDNCANATSLPCGTTNLAGTTTGCVSETSPGCGSGYGVWYTFTGDGNSTTISTDAASGFDQSMGIYSGSCGSLSSITCQDASGSGGIETYTFTTSTGINYYIYIAYYGSGTTTGDFTISRTCTSLPSNDNCANSTSLPCGTTNLAGSTNLTSVETSPGCGSGYGVWYTFTGDGNSTTISTDAASGFDHSMGVYSGSCGSLSSITCQDASGSDGVETYTFTATSGVNYYIYVAYYGSGTTTGNFTISRTCTSPPSNDNCANATSLPCGTTNLAGTTIGCVSETSPGCASNYGVWYTFTGDGNSTTITVQNVSLDTEFGLYSGSCGSLTSITCEDAFGSMDPEVYTFSTTVGVNYYVYVGYYDIGTTTGNFTISRSCSASPCSSVISIANCGSSNSQTYTGGGSGSWSTSFCGYTTPGLEQIYSFVAPTTGTYSLEVTTADGYVDYGWQASSCNSTGWTCIADILSPGTYGSMNWTAGTTYYILLDDENSIAGTHTFYINCPPCAVAAGTASASPGNFCPAVPSNTTLSLTGEDPAATIQWQVSTDGGTTWSNIPGATTDPWVQAVSTSSMYQALVTNGCTSTSVPVSVTYGCSIIQPTSGFASTSIACGSSYNYYDSGGSGSAYSSNENGLITISPDVAGQYVSVTVNSFNIENGYEYLYVFDGDNASATLIGIYTGTIGAGATITASSANPSGALSFRFTSNSSTNNAGWNLSCSCTGSPAAAYPTSTQDCAGAIVICDDSPLVGGSNGIGFNELPQEWSSCLGIPPDPGEVESTWYAFSSATDGTIGFDIIPDTQTDYDWAIWGPYSSLECPVFTNDDPIRCNASHYEDMWGVPQGNINGNTGLASFSSDIIEENGNYPGEVTDQYCRPLTVYAGEIYVLMLDNWEGNAVGFQLNWNLSDGATLDCDPPLLPVTLSSFYAECDFNKTILNWTTQTEVNNNFFVIQKSFDGKNFKEIGKLNGAGNSNMAINYSFTDNEENDQLAYYRLLQVDYDGSVKYHRIISSNCFEYSWDVFSNLANNKLELRITSSIDEKVTINLYNSTGHLIIQQIEKINAGFNAIDINNLNISSGIYLLSIIGEYSAYTEKLYSK